MSKVSECLPSDALLQHLPSYLGFSYPGRGDISSRLLQQSTAAVPYLGWEVSPYHHVPDLQRGIAPPLLGLLLPAVARPSGVGGSFQLPSLASGSRWLLRVTAPGFGHTVASPGRRPDLRMSLSVYFWCDYVQCYFIYFLLRYYWHLTLY